MSARRLRAAGAALLVAAAVVPAAGWAQGGAAAGSPAAAQAARESREWPVRTREHVDLWLHGLALTLDDTAAVPLFRRGYRAEARARRARANTFTQLDAERDRLRARLAVNPGLALNAQFVPLAFPSWEELRAAADLFVSAGGNPRRANDPRTAAVIGFFAQTFPQAADREWLRVYVAALQDERDKAYRQEWLALQRDRAPALAAADTLWQRQVRPRLGRFLGGTQQRTGELLLSPVIGGEGRTQGGTAVVAFPARSEDAAEVSYVAVHEVTGTLVGQVVEDNTSPADRRAGVADRYVSAGQVRAGYLLLQRAAPQLAAGYARFYLREGGQPAPAAGAEGAALARAFPLPAAILEAITRQVEVVEGGI